MKNLTWIVMVAALGCGKKDGGNEAAKTADKPADKPAEPFKGPLTSEIILGAKDMVKPFDPWDAGFAKLQAKLGAPTKVDGTKYSWAVQQGDDCTYFYVSKDDAKKLNYGEGFVVGTVMTPMKVGKSGPSGNLDECLAVLGKDSGPPEDPAASPPPADGKATVALIVDNAVKARSKWNGAKVEVTGKLAQISTSTSTSGSTTTTSTSLTLADDKDADKQLDCLIDGDMKAKFTSGKPVTVTATVDIGKWMNGKGETTFKPELKSCAVK